MYIILYKSAFVLNVTVVAIAFIFSIYVHICCCDSHGDCVSACEVSDLFLTLVVLIISIKELTPDATTKSSILIFPVLIWIILFCNRLML